MSGLYKKIQTNYPVCIVKEFWNRLTGDENFYITLTNAIGDVASEYDGSQHIDEIITELAKKNREKVRGLGYP